MGWGTVVKIIGTIPGLFLLLFVISVSGGNPAGATSFTPTEYTVTLAGSTPSANSDLTVDYKLDSPNSLEAAHISFIPSSFGVAAGSSIPDGALVGSLAPTANESQSNSPCSN